MILAMRMKVLVYSIPAVAFFLVGASAWGGGPASNNEAEHAKVTASFLPPEHCVEDQKLAMAIGAVQACVQRFSATHEFTVILNESRLPTSKEDVVSNVEIAAMAVNAHIAKLRAANEGQPGITLGMFEVSEQLRPEENGADYCGTALSIVIDRRVPGYEGEEFRIWAETFVCARADSSDNSIQLVELRSSERFRVKTDQFRERFRYLVPFGSALEAERSLTMN
jgi:hypothetical protein